MTLLKQIILSAKNKYFDTVMSVRYGDDSNIIMVLEAMTATLSELKALALDCQATGANADRCRLLEIGWMPTSAHYHATPEASLVHSYLIRSKTDTEIPSAVKRITGISNTSMMDAVSAETVWHRLINAARTVAAENQTSACPVIIHFARFEEPFLRKLRTELDPTTPFPFQIICTHAIAIRLLPDLPRRGIRALAGYFGHSMPKFKRSTHHVLATVFIWQNLVALLRTNCNVHTLQQLIGWFAATNPSRRSTRMFPMSPQIRLHLPHQPGIYRMRHVNGDLLYIGKAKSLKQRVNSYFRRNVSHPEHILEMLTQARDLDFSLTQSALEAAILESDEIKHHSPLYNRALHRHQRNLVFCTKDLRQHSILCDHQFSLGPLPGGKLIDAMAAFGKWLTNGMRLSGDDHDGIGYTLLALPRAYAPEIQCLREGFDFFRRNHRYRLENQSPLRVLTALGAKFWREHRQTLTPADADREVNTDNNNADAQQHEKSVNAHGWTPDDVAGVIESILMQSAHLIRRARWFCLLSESALAWASADNPDRCKNLIVFERGLIRDRYDLNLAKNLPVPPGFARSFHARQKYFDLITYDRLRVLTTELRRIISEGRRIELRLSPTVRLKRHALKRALQWV